MRDLLERWHDDFTEVLSHIAGRREWGVKAYVDPAAAAPTAPAGNGGGEGAAETARPGTAYLKRRQASLRNREQRWRQATARAERIHAALSAVAVASRLHRPQDPQLSGRDDWMVLNGAYLVDERRSAEFAAALDGSPRPGTSTCSSPARGRPTPSSPWIRQSRPEVSGDV